MAGVQVLWVGFKVGGYGRKEVLRFQDESKAQESHQAGEGHVLRVQC